LFSLSLITQRDALYKETLFFVIKPTRCTKFTNLFCHETLRVSDSSSVHHHEFIHCTLSNGVCHTGFEQEHMPQLESCLQTCMTYTIAECTVNKLLMMDRRTARNMYRVSCQNKFVKLVHLVGFITKKFVTMHGHMIVKKCSSAYSKELIFSSISKKKICQCLLKAVTYKRTAPTAI
jgi:hypothetical protein